MNAGVFVVLSKFGSSLNGPSELLCCSAAFEAEEVALVAAPSTQHVHVWATQYTDRNSARRLAWASFSVVDFHMGVKSGKIA